MPYFFRKNLQGDIIAVTDQYGTEVVRYRYDAWGKCTVTEDCSTCNIANINPFRYRGYYYDTEIGMYYLQSRYYDPNVGRFINADETVFLYACTATAENNLFTYCKNSPINHCDAFGFFSRNLVLSSSLTSSLGAALPGIMAGTTSSIASIKAAITLSFLIAVCIAAVAIAIIGIVYIVNAVISLTISAERVIEAVKEKVKAKGVSPSSLRAYTVYVIVIRGTVDVVYVGMTRNYFAREKAHSRRFPKSMYTMMPIATGLTRSEARTLEQTIITAYTLKNLVNIINSIAKKNWEAFLIEFAKMESLIESWLDPE